MSIQVTKVQNSRLKENMDFSFGRTFTDHMLVADYVNGQWEKVEIVPYQSLSFDPSIMSIHYGQSIFEGIKAYLNKNGEAVVFRPEENFKRFNQSAERMEMPTVPASIFMDGMQQLIALDKAWIPQEENYSLYIRPFMFATDQFLGVRPSLTYKFMIILSPSGPYYAKPARIIVEEKYTRAAPGGVGMAKNAGNYGGSLKAATEAQKQDYDQVLWTDAFEHKWLQEVGTMNVMFVFKDKIVTPSLEDGTILAGITRKSAITVLKEDMGKTVEERKISIDELVDEYKKGNLLEAFGTGTAATISLIAELKYKNEQMVLDTNNTPIAKELAKRLSDIRLGLVPDNRGWIFHI